MNYEKKRKRQRGRQSRNKIIIDDPLMKRIKDELWRNTRIYTKSVTFEEFKKEYEVDK